MSYPPLDEQRDYLESLYASCAPRPQIHAHQLIALERERALCAGAKDLGSYLATSAECFELTRSAWLDRLANQVRVAVLLDDRWAAQASLTEYVHALRANGKQDWVECLVRGAAVADQARRRSAECGSGLSRTLANLIGWRTSEPRLDDCLRDAQGNYLALVGAQPDFDRASLQGRAFFRLRIPWDDTTLPLLAGWLEALEQPRATEPAAIREVDPLDELARLQYKWQRSLGQRGCEPTGSDPVSLETLLAGYRTLTRSNAAALCTAARRLLDAACGAASPSAALARLVRGGHLAEVAAASLRERADAALARQTVWPDPFVAHHWQSLLASLGQARTPTEVDLFVAHAEACFALEADWNRLWMAVALAPFRAALLFRLNGAEAHAGVEKAVTLCEQLLGRGPRAMLAVPHVAQFFRTNLSRVADPTAPSPGAWLGEAGFDVIAPMRAWAAAAAATGEPVSLEPERIVGEAVQLLERALAREPRPGARRWIQLWGRRAAPEACGELQRSPARPPIPGFQ